MMMSITVKLVPFLAAVQIAVTEIINEAVGTANRVGTLGMQGLLAFMLIICFLAIVYYEKKRTQDRKERDSELTARYELLLKHHSDFAAIAQQERTAHMEQERASNERVYQLQIQSVKVMEGISASNNALVQWLKENKHKPQ